MTDVKRLLAEATPLPWTALIDNYDDGTMFLTADPTEGQAAHARVLDREDAALIVYAVNHLPDYLAAVEALGTIASLGTDAPAFGGEPADFHRSQLYSAIGTAARALARLRDEVPA